MMYFRAALLCGCVAVLAVRPVCVAGAAEDEAIVPKDQTLKTLWEDGEFTEGVAVSSEGTVYFSDIAFDVEKPGRILKYEPATGDVSVHSADSGKSNGLFFDARGRLLACCGANGGLRAVCVVNADGTMTPLVERFNGRRLNSPNDLVVHPSGWIYFSDPRYVGPEPMELDLQSVYRIDKDGDVVRVTTHKQIQKPNGVHVAPDGKTLYVAETNNGSVDVTQDTDETRKGRMTLNAFPIRADGSLGEKRVLVDFGDQLGTDGMTLDVQGRIYAAVRSAERFGIVVYAPDGTELAYIKTPSLPTNCCFGRDKQQHTLYITAGGGLYAIELNATGFHTVN